MLDLVQRAQGLGCAGGLEVALSYLSSISTIKPWERLWSPLSPRAGIDGAAWGGCGGTGAWTRCLPVCDGAHGPCCAGWLAGMLPWYVAQQGASRFMSFGGGFVTRYGVRVLHSCSSMGLLQHRLGPAARCIGSKAHPETSFNCAPCPSPVI